MIPGGASSRGSVPSEAVAAPSSGSESGRASVHDDALQDPRVCRYCGKKPVTTHRGRLLPLSVQSSSKQNV